jgi:hypothetical protein
MVSNQSVASSSPGHRSHATIVYYRTFSPYAELIGQQRRLILRRPTLRLKETVKTLLQIKIISDQSNVGKKKGEMPTYGSHLDRAPALGPNAARARHIGLGRGSN